MNTLAMLLVLSQSAVARPTPAVSATPAANASTKPVAKLGGGFGQKPAPAGKVRVVIKEEDLVQPQTGGTFSVAGTRGAPSPPASAPAPAPAAGLPPPSSDDETAWKERVAGLREDLVKAQKDYDAADRANTVVAFGRPGHDYETLMAIRNATLTPYRLRLEEVQSALAGLTEECRRSAGCQPGWVR